MYVAIVPVLVVMAAPIAVRRRVRRGARPSWHRVAVPHRRGLGRPRGAAGPLAARRVPLGRGRRRAPRHPGGTRARGRGRHPARELRRRRGQRAGPRPRASALQRAHDARARVARGRRRRRPCSWRPSLVDVARFEPAHHRASAGRDAPGRRPGAAPRPADRPATHRRALRARRPSSAATTTSSCSPSPRSTPTRRSTPLRERASPTSRRSTARPCW